MVSLNLMTDQTYSVVKNAAAAPAAQPPKPKPEQTSQQISMAIVQQHNDRVNTCNRDFSSNGLVHGSWGAAWEARVYIVGAFEEILLMMAQSVSVDKAMAQGG
jgi:hypothetical protein|mmetsp:Transcript_43687/g.73628  ORF Transcript_43687/g.73628 Transcript_43687/m.73628 type:complete len:103 (-) Transcript_43687:1221-1529(-)